MAALECTKFVFGRGSTPNPAGGAYSAPPSPSWFKGGATSKGRGEEGKGRKGVGEGRDRKEKGRGREEKW